MFFDGSSSSRKEVNLGGKRKGLAANAKDKASFVEQVVNDSPSSPLYSPQSPLLHPSSSPRSLPSALSAKLCDAAKSGCITGILSLVITSIPYFQHRLIYFPVHFTLSPAPPSLHRHGALMLGVAPCVLILNKEDTHTWKASSPCHPPPRCRLASPHSTQHAASARRCTFFRPTSLPIPRSPLR